MAWYFGNYGEPIYVSNGDPRFNRDGIFYQEPAPVSFRMPPFYNDVFYYRRSFRDQHPADFSHGGDPYRYPYLTPTAPWRLNYDYPHYGGYPVLVVERPREDDEEDSTLEFYAPQLYSDSRERQVVDVLKAFPGVVNVVADQWEKKVVVVGNGFCEEHVLRRLKLVPRMKRSMFWRDRR